MIVTPTRPLLVLVLTSLVGFTLPLRTAAAQDQAAGSKKSATSRRRTKK